MNIVIEPPDQFTVWATDATMLLTSQRFQTPETGSYNGDADRSKPSPIREWIIARADKFDVVPKNEHAPIIPV